jgi:tellurite resistance protein
MGWPRRVPPNFFGIAFGLAGLAEAWRAAAPVLGTPAAVAYGFSALAAAAWLLLTVLYLAQGDPVLAPFVSLAAITPMILATTLDTVAFTAGRVLTLIFLAVTYAYGGWLTGDWIAGKVPQEAAHPGYFLPTVAGALVGAGAAAIFRMHTLAEASFGVGVICWLLLGSTVLNRLFFKRALPPALVPTLAIELAPPAAQLRAGVLDLSRSLTRRRPPGVDRHRAAARRGRLVDPGPGADHGLHRDHRRGFHPARRPRRPPARPFRAAGPAGR